MARNHGGIVLSGSEPTGAALRARLAAGIQQAHQIIINISVVPLNSLTFWEIKYIFFRPWLWHKVRFLYNATFR